MRRWRLGVLLLSALVAFVALAAMSDAALAQSPFGMGAPAGEPAPLGGLVGWILLKQAEFYRALSATIRQAKSDGSAVWALLGISFAYGIFHAAGPGHGKGVISSYLVANQETWKRGVVMSFASALLQALVAVAIVGVAAAILNATAKSMADAVRYIETVSYGLIVLVGLRLLWVKGRSFIRAWHSRGDEHAHEHEHHHEHAHDHHHHHHGHDHDHAHHHAHDHDHAAHDHAHHHHDEDDHDHAGHSHGPEPAELAGPGGWARGFTAILAVGARPCSGAILVLVFALAQGLFWAGVASTFVMSIGTAITVAAIATFAVAARDIAARIAASRAGGGLLFMRGMEVAAAALVVVFGFALLAGYMVSERMMGFA